MANSALSQPKFGQRSHIDDRIKRGRQLQTIGRFRWNYYSFCGVFFLMGTYPRFNTFLV